MNARHWKEMCAMWMIGDGVLTAVSPRRHVMLWRGGPKSCKRMADSLIRRPMLTRTMGIAATAAGIWWAMRQRPVKAKTLLWRRSS